MSASPGTALITGASTGIGATYADRLARRGHDLILVARDAARLEAVAARIRRQVNVAIEVLPADLTDKAGLAKVEHRLATDPSITLLVNNAGAAAHGAFADLSADQHQAIIDLNVTALTRLTSAAAPAFAARSKGAIINLASVLGLVHEIGMPVYNATKAYVLMLSRALQQELRPKGVYIQAVLPGATRTEIWERAGTSLDALPPEMVMDVGELVDAALVGFDRQEQVTIPSLPDVAQWNAFEATRTAMLPNLSKTRRAPRYHETTDSWPPAIFA
ncbi:MAG TPA: SDR family oxidoreductase [Caulobacteraceae bacterium]